MKAILKTTGAFMLVDPFSGQCVPHHRPAVVEVTPFFHARLGLGQLTIVQNQLPDIATDAELVALIKEHGVEEGVDTYLLTLDALTAEPEKPTVRKGKTGGSAV